MKTPTETLLYHHSRYPVECQSRLLELCGARRLVQIFKVFSVAAETIFDSGARKIRTTGVVFVHYRFGNANQVPTCE